MVALLVLLIGVFQIAVCAADYDRFLPAPTGIPSHSSSLGDADGCLCGAQNRVPSQTDVPDPLKRLKSKNHLRRDLEEPWSSSADHMAKRRAADVPVNR